MAFISNRYGFSTYLLLGLVILVLITTLSAGAPAYWLTRTQLEAQLWAQVNTAQQSTLSLLQAEQDRLRSTAFLLAERPTLHRLLETQAWDKLRSYLQAFQRQSQLDILLLCHKNQTLLISDAGPPGCPTTRGIGFELVQARPALVVSQSIDESDLERPSGTVVVGLWLNENFLRRLAVNTGGQQSILHPDGARLGSSFTTAPTLPLSRTMIGKREIQLAEGYYYAGYMPLIGSDDQMSLISEVALPADTLLATERRALAALIGSTGLVALLGVVVGAWYIRSLTGSLHKLTQASKQISQGAFATPLPQSAGPAEVATLATVLKQSQAAMLRALAEQSQTRAWLNTLLQSIVEGVVTLDPQNRITFFTQGAEELTGWSAAEALGQPVDQVFRPAEAEKFSERLPPPGSNRLIEIISRGDKRVTLAVTSAQLLPPDGNDVQVALVLRDVTEEEAVRHLRSYILANISHEFRTPLSTLTASLELLLDEVDQLTPAEIQELLKPTHLSLLSLQTLIDNLLESSRIEAGRFTVRRQPFDLNQVLTQAFHIVRPQLDRHRQTLAVTGSGHFSEIHGDAARLVQVLVNLLINASKYSPLAESIELHLEQTNQTLRIAILDRGPGIPPLKRLHLFRRFVRLDDHSKEQYGTGLGLYVVKSTVEAHGGRVGIEERAGGGSIFWFELPLIKEE